MTSQNTFQFLNGTIKSSKGVKSVPDVPSFQFLNGTIKSRYAKKDNGLFYSALENQNFPNIA